MIAISRINRKLHNQLKSLAQNKIYHLVNQPQKNWYLVTLNGENEKKEKPSGNPQRLKRT
jgi:hypothetical protein